jgi:hypothetical protein
MAKIDEELKSNGYKFIGWSNNWATIDLDEDGSVVNGDALGKRAVAFEYSKVKHPEYFNCREQNHRPKEIQHFRNGMENTVICDICRIFWKYDSSD